MSTHSLRHATSAAVAAAFVAAGWAVWATPVAAQKPARDIPMKVMLGVDPRDGIRADAPFDYVDGLQNVMAILYPAGNLRFTTQIDTRAAAMRQVVIDFRDQPAPALLASTQAVVLANQVMHGANGDFRTIQDMTVGDAPIQKLTRFDWRVPVNTTQTYAYSLGYGTDMDGNGIVDSLPVSVTCVAPENTSENRGLPCVRWLVAPQLHGTAMLTRVLQTVKGGKVTTGPSETLGTWEMPFRETLVRK